GNKTVLQRVEDWQVTNGASIEETIYGFDQKVWLNDVANIGANLIPQSSNAWEDGGLWIEGGGENALRQHIRTKDRLPIQPNTTYTLSSNSTYVSAIERVDIHQYLYTGGWINRRTIPRNGEVSFTTWGTADTVRITLIAREGFGIPASFIEHPDGRVKIKLEVGNTATPMLNAISRVEQLADSVSIAVAEIDGSYVTQSQFNITAGEVDTLVSKTDGHDTQIGNLSVSYDEISATVVNINEDVESYGTWINQTDSLISSKVWINDVADVQPNLIPMANFDYPQSKDFWSGTGGNADAVDSDGFYVYRSTNSGTQLGIYSPYFDLK